MLEVTFFNVIDSPLKGTKMSLTEPEKITDNNYRFDAFENNKVLLNKKKNHLPAMGWNSWNAFGSGNTEALTKEMADAILSVFGYDKYNHLVGDWRFMKKQF